MGRTVIEKIIAGHSGGQAKPGGIVWMDLDIRSARDFGGPNVAKNYAREYGEAAPADPAKTFFTFDLCAPACTLKYADNQQACRNFARKHGLTVYDVDKGIGSHVMIEEALARPGSTVVGTDSHMNILGAVGSFGQGMGDVDIAFAFKTGRTWFEVPESVKVVLMGRPSPAAEAKDLALFLCRELGTKRIALRSAEFFGEAVRTLDLAGRITLCSMITEMAGIIGFIPERNTAFARDVERFGLRSGADIGPDPDAVYAETITLDVTGLGPLVAAPPSPNTVKTLTEVRGIRIDSGFIGSCTNGRTEDFVRAADILRCRKIKPGVMLKVVPATRRVYQELLDKGILGDLFAAGAIVVNPGCGGCAEGHVGLTGKGEVEISTGNRNFPGKQGKGPVYLASPVVVAASCLKGEIAGPEDV
ncbi:MAG: aconitase/3-isopropylmalate dehydratase large subunit family protein [Candidatus Aminicenantes bacterium]|nr:aconitase/3-isopropylmalate dehydratase large subunit family protein [Candidatus Aminicenantes bacterium]